MDPGGNIASATTESHTAHDSTSKESGLKSLLSIIAFILHFFNEYSATIFYEFY